MAADKSISVKQLKVYAEDLSRIYAEEKEKRQQLEISNYKLHHLLDSLDNGIISTDPNLNINEVNSEFYKIFRIEPEQSDLNLKNILTEHNWSKVLANLDELNSKDKVLVDVYGDYSILYIVNRIPIFNTKNDIESYVFIFVDETSIRRSEKLKDEFIALVSHEIRTPLSSISGYTSLLKTLLSDKLSEEEASFFGSIESSIKRLVRTIEELLAVSQKTVDLPSLEFSEFNLCDAVKTSFQNVDVKLSSVNGQIIGNKPAENCVINGNFESLVQSFDHILDNAIEFGGEGVTINVDLKSDGNNFILTFKDNGPGIDKAHLERIFMPFYQVEDHLTRNHEGIGLGLSIVRRTVSLHGGILNFDSEIGKGTTVEVIIPKVREELEQLKSVQKNLENERERAESFKIQMERYAEDLKELFNKNKSSRKQLVNYAQDLNTAYIELKQSKEELEEAYLDTIFKLSLVSELNDDSTGAHIVRMSMYVKIIAEKMGLDEEIVKLFQYASPMHDIGKIGIPDKVLTNTGSLLPDEIEIMKKHTEIGAKIFKNSTSKILKTAQEISLSHHEKWNGKGYPNGLAGEEIPISGRIVAVADVFDALTSDRPYKAAYPLNVALEHIKSEKGKHFDPKVVDAFLSSVDKIESVAKETTGKDLRDIEIYLPSLRDQ